MSIFFKLNAIIMTSEDLTKHKVRDWISVPVDSGSSNQFIGISFAESSAGKIVCMKTRRRICEQGVRK